LLVREDVLLAGLCERKILFQLKIYDRLRQATTKRSGCLNIGEKRPTHWHVCIAMHMVSSNHNTHASGAAQVKVLRLQAPTTVLCLPSLKLEMWTDAQTGVQEGEVERGFFSILHLV